MQRTSAFPLRLVREAGVPRLPKGQPRPRISAKAIVPCESSGVPPRVAGACGLLAFLTMNVGWILGGLAQPVAYSFADDDISDLGALTASSPWLYNQLGANLTGLLLVLFGLGMWRALSPDVLGRLGAGAVIVAGLGTFLDGFFRLDCRGIDMSCDNNSWHSSTHKLESGITSAAIIAAPLLLALAFRRVRPWHAWWLPTLAVVPALILAGVLFSVIGDGAATRASSVTWFAWIALLGARLLWRPAESSSHSSNG